MLRQFDLEFKINAVRLIVEQGLKVVQVSKDLGIGLSTLERWLTEYRRQGEAAFAGKGKARIDDNEAKKLARENEILKRERDILKKALAIFSSQ